MREPQYDMAVIKTRVNGKPNVRLLASHNLPRSFSVEQRQTLVKVTEQAHAIMKQIAEVWGVSLPSYLTYALLSAIQRDAGVHFKWLDHLAKDEVVVEEPIPSAFPPSLAVKPEATTTAALNYDPLSGLRDG